MKSRMVWRIIAITGCLLVFFFLAVTYYFNSPAYIYKKFRDFGNITKALDLSDRDSSLSVAEVMTSNDLVENCRENFSAEPCRWPGRVVLRNEIRRRDDPRLSELTFLSNKFINPLSSRLHPLDPDYISPLGINYECEPDEFDAFLAWIYQARADSMESSGLVVALPEAFLHCQRMSDKALPAPNNLFWVWVEGNAVGQIDCHKLSEVPNPTCKAYLYLNMGEIEISLWFIPAVNVSRYVRNLHAIFTGFMSRHASELVGVNSENYFNTQFEISPEAEVLMESIEKDLL